ncbi:imidazoleglycerol-phosphate dehydratase HisB [Anoxynatronum sibiricum]|uniref:Imidazoleglycerol-phosphate dehydratase n=1 Tax=Anoxynatronum sibiricum TaxID=210623 RepID=A0ABU9VUJ5_9CLOT
MGVKRIAAVNRRTVETDIGVKVNVDGTGKSDIATGVGFFDHMLHQVARHGLVDLSIRAEGDVHVDDHHTVEDVGIVLGQALAQAVGDKTGMVRYASVYTPMDEALSRVILDFSGRAFLHFDVTFTAHTTGDFDVQLVEEFFRAVAVHGGITLHMTTLYGKNDHHIIETLFKAFGRAIDQATRIDKRIQGPMSTKESL